jgi:hypothetical protein
MLRTALVLLLVMLLLLLAAGSALTCRNEAYCRRR